MIGLSVATAVQWHRRAALPCRKANGALRQAPVCRGTRRGPVIDAATLGSSVQLPLPRPQGRIFGRHRLSFPPSRSETRQVLRHGSSESFVQQPAERLRSFEKEVMCNRCRRRPLRGRLVHAGPTPNRGEPVLPEPGQIQVEREWCPVTPAASADLDGQGLQVVRNTYQNCRSLADPGDRYEGPGGRVRLGDRSRRILMLFDEKDRPSWPASWVRSRSVLGLSGSPTPCAT